MQRWSIRGDVDQRWHPRFKAKVRNALLNMQDEDLLASFPRSGFMPAKNTDYLPILKVARESKLID